MGSWEVAETGLEPKTGGIFNAECMALAALYSYRISAIVVRNKEKHDKL